MVRPSITQLHHLLRGNADPKTKSWWESYVKGSAPFLGVKMSVIRSLVHTWHTESVADKLEDEEQRELALALFHQPHTEEKLAGMLFLQEILLPAGLIRCPRDVDRFAHLFASGVIHDWNVCDWFCVKVLGPLIENEGPPCAERIAAWRTAENLWQARASLVAFVKVADQRAYYPLVEESCRVLIRREERFAKTGVGWILRDISRHDEAFVRRVVDQSIRHFSPESLRNATKYFSKNERSAAIQRLKHAQAGAGP
jgi:3-methyladenine DNA glycosylase AlkD